MPLEASARTVIEEHPKPATLPSPPDRESDAWSKLWHAGVLHSCSTAIEGNYDGEIEAFWNAHFDGLLDGQRVVDVGTGNGALALLAKRRAAHRGIALDIHGVDAADIDPPRWAAHAASFAGITFHPGTRMETLPFEAGSVSLVTSQYAFEYCHPREPALEEIFRVIGAAGRAAFLLHSTDSLISLTARQQQQACDLLFEETGILDRAHELVSNLPGAHSPATVTPSGDSRELIQHAFNIASVRLVEGASSLPEAAILRKAFHYLHATLERAQSSPPQALQYLERAREDLENERTRLQHLCGAIMGMHELADLRDRCVAAGYAASALAPIDQGTGNRMGWTLVVSR